MSDAMPKGDNSRRAVKWISANLEENSGQDKWKLIEEAITKFDLNPMESELLMQFYRSNKSE